MDDKLKFYRSTLVQITKGLIGYTPMDKLVEDADKITEKIIQMIYGYKFKERPSIKDCVTSTSITCTDPNFFKGINPDYLKTESNTFCASNETKDKLKNDLLKTEPMRTIVDNGPQYQPNQKPYGTLGEHWKELMVLFDFKCGFDNWKELLKSEIIPELLEYKCLKPRDHFFRNYYKAVNEVYQKLGIEFIEDFVKACEKCEE